MAWSSCSIFTPAAVDIPISRSGGSSNLRALRLHVSYPQTLYLVRFTHIGPQTQCGSRVRTAKLGRAPTLRELTRGWFAQLRSGGVKTRYDTRKQEAPRAGSIHDELRHSQGSRGLTGARRGPSALVPDPGRCRRILPKDSARGTRFASPASVVGWSHRWGRTCENSHGRAF